ncbi:Hypothetical predicted protein [Mytilus galloprovincialis]|uniref:Chromo domain-containing protein n=1 Tax=Mytilus galloprovincialis TaxID=29158 RepID=A0A8B6BVZ6_MYTGA|nr:Hypothetical predicted protein [Mytilus galloprovincialis]
MIYCVKCRRKTDTVGLEEVITSNGRRRKVGTCTVCGARKSQFVAAKGAGLMNKLINRMPVEMHLPGHNFTGPGTNLSKRLNADGTPKAWSRPINRVDQAAYHHDLCYAKHKDTAARNSICDKTMLTSLDAMPNPTARERTDRSIVRPIIGTKARFGLGDFNDEEIQGSFYEPELQRTDQDVYRIEKILRRRTRGGVKEAFVKWKGYPKEFNSWIKQSDLE